MTVSFTAGQKLRASDLLQFPLGLVARNLRTTAIATTATSSGGGQRVLTVGGPVVAGRIYRVRFRGALKNSGANVRAFITFFYTTDGTEPTTSDSIIQQGAVDCGPTAASTIGADVVVHYAPATDHTFTVTAGIHGVSGTTTADAGTAVPCEMWIEDVGEDVAISGTIYT